MPAAHSDSVTSSLPIWMPVISFPCLIVVSQISNTLFNTSGKSGYPYLVPDFRGKTFSFSLLSMILALYACSVVQSCPTLCNPMDCSPTGSSVHGISQAEIMEWVVTPYSKC